MTRTICLAALVLVFQPQRLLAQSAGVASLQTAAPTSNSTFSIVPIMGITGEVNRRLSIGAYGLYSTDPRVQILCVAAPLRLNRYLALNPIYEFISPPRIGQGQRQTEHQVNLALDAGLTWRHLRLDMRNRIGRRFVNSSPDSTRYRNLVSVACPLPGRSKIEAFHWQEFFYEGVVSRWAQHHIAAGVQRPLSSGLIAQLYYFRLAAAGRGDIHALGITMVYRFPRPAKRSAS